MSKRFRFISLKRLKIHELRQTLRIMLGKETNWPKQSDIYSKLELDAIQSFMKAFGQCVLGYLVASSLRSADRIGLTVSSLDIYVPASYFLFGVSLILFVTALSFNHLSAAMSAKAKIAGKIRIPGFSVGAYDVLQQRSQNGLGVPAFTSLFHRETLPTQAFLQILFVSIVISVLIPLAALGYFLFSEQLQLLLRQELPLIERMSSAAGLLCTAASSLFVVIFHIPLPFKKNEDSIRWSFLYYLPPHEADEEKFKRWTEKKN